MLKARSEDVPLKLYSVQELADLLGVPMKTVYNWNYLNTGPRRIALGKRVGYLESDVRAWLESRAIGGADLYSAPSSSVPDRTSSKARSAAASRELPPPSA